VHGISDRAAAASAPGPASNMASVARMQRMPSTTGVWGPGSLLGRSREADAADNGRLHQTSGPYRLGLCIALLPSAVGSRGRLK